MMASKTTLDRPQPKRLSKVSWVFLPSLVLSFAASAAATLVARRLRKRRGDVPQVREQDRSVDVDTKNFVFVFMPFAISLDALRVFGEIRRSASKWRARRILNERYARGEIEDERYEQMRRELEV